MESKEYFEKIMQDYNQNGKGRSLRKYCKDEAVDYNWLIEFRKTYPARSNDREKPASAGFIPLEVEKSKPQQACSQVSQLTLLSPEGQAIEIKSSSIKVVADLLLKLNAHAADDLGRADKTINMKIWQRKQT